MTEQIYTPAPHKINTNKKQLEEGLNLKISVKSGIVFLDGTAEDEYLGLQVIEALNLGFSCGQALLLKNDGFVFEKIPIKSIANRRNL